MGKIVELCHERASEEKELVESPTKSEREGEETGPSENDTRLKQIAMVYRALLGYAD